ncbi:MAG: hypothetical protein LBN27_01050 [Prevotellaceae bacterium]|jgi:hypothetical protein|nr:hypothetical protein [Prevotellaceae bacterium]
MKYSIIIFLSIFVLADAWCQSDTVFIKYNQNDYDESIQYKVDTILFETRIEREILYGTRVLPWTINQQYAKGYGLYLENVHFMPCEQNSQYEGEKDKILSIAETESVLKIEIKLWGNCCHSFLCDVEIVNEKTINLITIGYGGSYCGCTCCFGLLFDFSILKDEQYLKLEDITINGNEKTRKKIRE